MGEFIGFIEPQLIANSLISFAAIMLLAVAFLYCHLVLKFYDFALPFCVCIGGYSAWYLCALEVPFSLSIVMGGIVAGGFNWFIEKFLYAPFSNRNASTSTLMIASLAIYIIGQNVIGMFFGTGIKVFESHQLSLIAFGIPSLTSIQMLLIMAASLTAIVYLYTMNFTSFGIRLRASFQNEELAKIVGIDTNKNRSLMYFVGGAIAGVAGVLIGADTGLTPTLGFSPFILAVVVVVLAGPLSRAKLVLASGFIAVASHITIWFVGADFLNAVVFSILLIFLALRAHKGAGFNQGAP